MLWDFLRIREENIFFERPVDKSIYVVFSESVSFASLSLSCSISANTECRPHVTKGRPVSAGA